MKKKLDVSLNESKKLERIIDNSLVEADDVKVQRAKALILNFLKKIKRDITVPDMLYKDWVNQATSANNAFNFSAFDSLFKVVNGMRTYINSEIKRREIVSDEVDDVLSNLKNIFK